MSCTNVYVIVRHNTTGRCFLLDRRYFLIDKPFTCEKVPENYCQKDNGWVPSFDWQKPLWAKYIDSNEFTAYWYEPLITL